MYFLEWDGPKYSDNRIESDIPLLSTRTTTQARATDGVEWGWEGKARQLDEYVSRLHKTTRKM